MRLAELGIDRQTIAGLGHNNPPAPTVIELADEAMQELAEFLNATPVITDPEHLVRARQLFDRVKGATFDLEAERVSLTGPLNKKLDSINGTYKALHNTDSKRPGTLDKVFNELKARLTAHAVAEEAERIRIAEAAQAAAEEARRAALQAELIEQQAKQDAVVGVVDTGVAEKTVAADAAFKNFEAASRFATRAERDVTFRVGNGHGRTLAMRTEKTLVLESYGRAITAIGRNEKIETAILSAARDYRKEKGKLPDGVTEVSERKF